MASIHPFRALRPAPDQASAVSSVPYDVVSADEARQLAADHPLSFLHVTRSEIDLPPGVDPYSPRVYEKALENLRRHSIRLYVTFILGYDEDNGDTLNETLAFAERHRFYIVAF
ncbi:MAG: DUF1015 family protein, partial [Acidobacteriota bacterium]